MFAQNRYVGIRETTRKFWEEYTVSAVVQVFILWETLAELQVNGCTT